MYDSSSPVLNHITQEQNPQLHIEIQVASNGPHNIFMQLSVTQEFFRIIPFLVYAYYRVYIKVSIVEQCQVNGFTLTNFTTGFYLTCTDIFYFVSHVYGPVNNMYILLVKSFFMFVHILKTS